MNAVAETNQANHLTLVNSSGGALAERNNSMFSLDGMHAMQKMAELMSTATVTIPKHLVNKPGDCLAVVMQAAQWEMNPYAVAQKTHLTQGGQLGYEAQLINAVVIARAPIKERPKFEFIGDWMKVLGKVKEMKGNSGGKYYVSDWQEKDEIGLGVRCSAIFKGESEARTIELLLVQCWPRFSTQWATDPQQQITYAAVRKWARRYSPDVILGVYAPEELDDARPPGERDMGAANVVQESRADKGADLSARMSGGAGQPKKPAERGPALADVLKQIAACTTFDQMTAAGEACAKIVSTDDKDKARAAYRDRVTALKQQATEAAAKADAGGPSYAEIAEQINAADSIAAVDAAADLARSIKDEKQREELIALAAKRVEELAPT